MNEKIFFYGEFVGGTKVGTRAPSSFFIEYHDHERGIADGTRAENTSFD
jgi:hypothetical protein